MAATMLHASQSLDGIAQLIRRPGPHIAIRLVEIIKMTLMRSVMMATTIVAMAAHKDASKLRKIIDVLLLENVTNSVEMGSLKEMILRLESLMELSLNNAMMATM
jgi:hypothetical protein